MKYQILFSSKNKKNMTNLSSAESAPSVVSVNKFKGIPYVLLNTPALVDQLDARLTDDQEVAGSTPAGSAAFCHGDWS